MSDLVRKAIRYIPGLVAAEGQSVTATTENGAFDFTVLNGGIDLGAYYYSVTLALTASSASSVPLEIPVVYDTLSGTWVAKLSRVNQEDREVDIDKAKQTMEDQQFLSSIGFQ